MFTKVLTACLLLPVWGFATQLMPWYDREFEVHSRTTYWLQSFEKLDVSSGSNHYRSNDSFLAQSFLICRKEWCLELEGTASKTRRHSFGMDNIKLTGRYQWLNDVIGDPVSLTTGLSIDQVFKNARHDIGSFHHGGIEAELHAAVGRETPCYQFWTSRWWGVGGIGMGDGGWPWVRLDGDWEHNWWNSEQLRFFVHSLWGLGHHNLTLKKHFPGYGQIRHQSIDGGVRYSHLFEGDLNLSVEYAYRIYAQNCPKNVQFFFIQIHYPFPVPYGLGKGLTLLEKWLSEKKPLED